MLRRCWVETTMQSNLILSMSLVFQNGSNADLMKLSSVPRFRYGWKNKLKRLHQTHQSSHVALTRKNVTNKLRRFRCSLQLKNHGNSGRWLRWGPWKSYLVGPILVSASTIIIWLQDNHLAAKLQRIEDWYWFSVTLCPSKKCFRHGNCHARLVFLRQ